MSKGWETKRLAEVCQIDPPKAEARKKLAGGDLVSFVPMSDLNQGQKLFTATQERPFSEVSGSYTFGRQVHWKAVREPAAAPDSPAGRLSIQGAGRGFSETIA